jgi:hypothetical protein
MKLEDIGFYTLSDNRALNVSAWSPMIRCELVLTDRCNFRCPYCRDRRPAAGIMCPAMRPHDRYILRLRNLTSAASRQREQKGRIPSPLQNQKTETRNS